MQFGYSLMGMNPQGYAEVARKAEDCGFDSIWVPEPLVLPAEMPPAYPCLARGPEPRPGTHRFDPWVSLGFMAPEMTKLRVSTQRQSAVRRGVVTREGGPGLDEVASASTRAPSLR